MELESTFMELTSYGICYTFSLTGKLRKIHMYDKSLIEERIGINVLSNI